MDRGLNQQQVRQFHHDGFLIVRKLIPVDAFETLIDELVEKVELRTIDAVEEGLLAPEDTYLDESFDTRLALVSAACRDQNWIWQVFPGKRHKTAGMFAVRTHPAILDAAESLIGAEILAHPQSNLRAKLPDQEKSLVPWHQDLAYLVPEDAGETLFVNFWIPLVNVTVTNGCLQVMRGSHRLGLIPHNYNTPTFHGIADADLPDCEVVDCEVDVGDVLMTMERVVHRSTPHTLKSVRWSLDIRYSCIGLPTGRKNVPGFVARSRENPDSVAKSLDDWLHVYEEAGLDPLRN